MAVLEPQTNDMLSQWQDLCGHIIKEFGEASFRSWVKPLKPLKIDEGVAYLLAPSRFMKDWVIAHYGDQITRHWKTLNPTINRISIDVGTANESQAPTLATIASATLENNEAEPLEDEDRDEFVSALDSRFTFENFVVGRPNELAYAASLRIAEAQTPPFNPLFLYGGVGLGKTHLMHAIAWQINKLHPQKKVIYLSAEKFMYQFIRSLRYKDTVAFKERFRNVDVLMIDDVQFIGGKEITQEEFFHTFNTLVDNNRQVILSADKSPSDLEKMEDRLKSRLGWGLVADIHPTNYELRLGILQAKVEQLHVKIPKDVMEFLAVRITSNIRELEGALNRIVAHATLIGRPITLDSTQDVLRDLLRSNDKRLTIEDIQKSVCEFYKIKVSDLLSSRRMQNIARPRQVAMYLAKALTTKSMPEIGRKFGGRDHTTVLHAVKKVQECMERDSEFAQDIRTLKRSLESL
jgi:chromosomal replication initiator protein